MQRDTPPPQQTSQEQALERPSITDDERYRGVFEHAIEGIFQTTPDGRYLAANLALARIYGYDSPRELTARFSDIGQQLYVDARRRAEFLRAMDEQDKVTDFVSQIYRKDGVPIWISENAVAVRDAGGKLLYYEGFVVDITARRYAEEALQRVREELEHRVAERTLELEQANASLRTVAEELRAARDLAERASRAKNDFLSRMSHELRTPLNAILGFAQLLDSPDASEVQLERVGHIFRAGRHLLDLINEILDIARIESGRMELSVEPVRVEDAVVEVISLLEPLAVHRNVELIWESAKEDAFVMADRQRLKQILLNLVANGIKYHHPDGGTVRIAACPAANDRWRIVIQDNGPGLSDEHLARLWVPFDRMGAEAGEVQGTGLGLPLSKRLAEAMGGFIDVQSQPGIGATFRVQLPCAKNPLPRIRDASTPLVRACPDAHVLYIEDNLSNLRLLEHLLKDYSGIELTSTMQGRVGFDLAREHLPDLILLDLHLPDISGRELLEMLRADASTRTIPVVVLSADATTPQIQRLRAAGADDYITKPIHVPRFIEVLERHLSTPIVTNGHA